jgi:ASC-1-like (ASCH) protein
MAESQIGKKIVATFSLNTPWFGFVKDGTKAWEGRSYQYPVDEWEPGDVLRVIHHTNSNETPFLVRVVQIRRFADFRAALTGAIPMSEVLPNVKTVEEGVQIYYKFVRQSTQDRYGVCLVQLAVIQSQN